MPEAGHTEPKRNALNTGGPTKPDKPRASLAPSDRAMQHAARIALAERLQSHAVESDEL